MDVAAGLSMIISACALFLSAVAKLGTGPFPKREARHEA
jgi:hypothetical protein